MDNILDNIVIITNYDDLCGFDIMINGKTIKDYENRRELKLKLLRSRDNFNDLFPNKTIIYIENEEISIYRNGVLIAPEEEKQ